MSAAHTRDTTIRARIDAGTKAQVAGVLATLEISFSDTIRLIMFSTPIEQDASIQMVYVTVPENVSSRPQRMVF